MNKKHFLSIIFIVFFSLVIVTLAKENNTVFSKLGSFLQTTVFALQDSDIEENQPSVFLNSSTGLSLSIQLTPGRPDTGKFALFIPGEGYYQGVIPLQNSGEPIVNPNGEVSAKFYPSNNGTPTSATIRMNGEINKVHMTLSLNIWINGVRYKFLEVTKPSDIKANELVEKVLDATETHDWPELYSYFSSSVKNTTSQAAFEALMNVENIPTITNIEKNGVGTVKNVSGVAYYIQPVTLTVTENGGTPSTRSTYIYLVFEQGAWKFLSTETPTP
jgi:hypothetical protein